jgi:carotenoid 1,2-hydratase
MTERGRNSIARSSAELAIGQSRLSWEGDTLVVWIDEVTAPIPSRIRGTVRVYPQLINDRAFALDQDGRHGWCPISPCARVQVSMERPAFRWIGAGYFDANYGQRPLEADFVHWDWSRASLPRGTAVLYDVLRRDGTSLSLAMGFDRRDGMQEFDPPPLAPLPKSRWGISRHTRTEGGCAASIVRTLEDGPFYARSTVASQLLGQPVVAMHESLSLDRFQSRWVQMLLPFRMPRWTR